VRRIEVMSFLEDLEREVREDSAETLRREPHGNRVASTADRVENRAIERAQSFDVEWGRS
jgi:hypothetical protein